MIPTKALILGAALVLPSCQAVATGSDVHEDIHLQTFFENETDPGVLANVAQGFGALGMCSAVHVTGLAEDVALREEVGAAGLITTLVVDYEERSVTSCGIDNPDLCMKAIWRQGIGCTLVDGMTEVELRGQELGDQSPLAPLNATEPWPLGTFFQMDENWPADVDRKCVEDAIDLDFSVDEYRARSMLIVRNGEMMFERYSDDVNEASPLLGWSMTKTLTVAMVGILVDEGRLDLNARLGADGLVPEWGGLLNRKRDITLNELVQMRTGILWTESWHLVNCLYNSGGDCAKYYAELPLVNEPGEVFDYSTGASMLLSRIVMENRGDPELTDFEWVRARLFKPLGMTSALVEPMPPGYFGGGSFGYMTARDWARLGHLFMHDGLWEDGTRIFSQEFGEYIRTASPATTEYGGQTWILDNYEGVSDAYYMSGFRFQKVINIPSMGLSIVRHAMAPLVLSLGDYWSIRDFLDTLLPCFPEFPANN